jgi:hypothetical protein
MPVAFRRPGPDFGETRLGASALRRPGVTGYSFSGYELVLIIWGIVWMIFGSGLVYLLHRYFAHESATVHDEPVVLAHPENATSETRELIGVGYH